MEPSESTPYTGRLRPGLSTFHRRALGTAALLALVLSASCQPESNPVAANPDDPDAIAGDEAAQLFTGATHVIERGVLDLVSRDDKRGGVYRFRAADAAPEIERDDFIVGQDGDVFLRRVLNAERVGDELVLETSLAYWHEVLEGGTYEESVPLETSAGGPALHNPLGLDVVMPLSPQRIPLDNRDICLLTDSLTSLIPGSFLPTLCNEQRDFTVGVGVVKVTVDGTITQIYIDEGFVEVSGTLGMSSTVDKGGLIGGVAPIFAPCNRANYSGCLTTPTGALLIDFIRKWAPQIPDGSLSPTRVCIPGTPVTIKRGYWVYPGGFQLPYWVKAVRETCRVTNIGELPQIELPSLDEFVLTPRPNIKGRMVMDVKGKGGLQLQIIPGPLGATAGAGVGGKAALLGSVGLFLTLDIDMAEAGVRVAVDFDEGLAIETRWTDDDGWTRNMEVTKTNLGGSLDPIGPDSVRVRAGITAQITGKACAALIGVCEFEEDADSSFSLSIGANVEAVIFRFLESQWSRTANENWMLDTDAAYEIDLVTGLELPLVGMLLPNVPLTWDPDPIDFWRFDLMDMYGTGKLEIATTTTGSSPDSDGYEVLVERADTLPNIFDPSSEPLGFRLDLGLPMRRDLENNGSQQLLPIKTPPCSIQYSDQVLAGLPPNALAAIQLARRLGVGPPNYGVSTPCQLLIADHTVRLLGVAENCTVVGGATQVVALEQRNLIEGRDGTTNVTFDVVCTDPPAPLGTLRVVTNTTGSDPDADGYGVSIAAVPSAPVPAGSIGTTAERMLVGLTPQAKEVTLDGVAPNCTVDSPNPVAVTVVSGATLDVSFSVTCAAIPTPSGAVRVSMETDGPVSDPDGFAVRLDGTLLAVLDGSGSVNLGGLTPGQLAVLAIDDIAPNCRLNGRSPTTVLLDPVDETAALPFDASCTDAPITTVSGTLYIEALPVRTATVRANDGTSMRLKGVLAAELLQMSGVTVAVHGVQAGGVLDVYGYSLVAPPEADAPRSGILVFRAGEYWLFGRDAVQLDQVPPRLADQVGRLVWVAGGEVGGQLVPDLFGIIREGR